MNELMRTVDFTEAIKIGSRMTKWIPGVINMAVFFFVGLCNGDLLDMTDYGILSWMIAYYKRHTEGKSHLITAMFDSELEGGKREFFWLHYEELRNQLPNLKITTNKGLSCRFKKYCKYMILEHHTARTPNGVYAYYRFNSVLFPLLISEKSSAMLDVLPVYGYALPDAGRLLISEYDNPKEITWTENEAIFPPDEVPDTEKNVECLTKDCTVIDNVVTKNKLTDSTRIRQMLGESGLVSSCFDDDFLNYLSDEFLKKSFDENLQMECIRWLVNYTKEHCKDESKIAGYFYKSVYNTNLISCFIEEKETSENKKKNGEQATYQCPVCGHNVRVGAACICGSSYPDCDNSPKDGFLHRKNALTLAEQEAYNKEHNEICKKFGFSSLDFQNRITQIESLNRKYGLID